MNMKRERLKKLGIQTINIVAKGYYINDKGDKINISNSVHKMVEHTELYSPKMGEELVLKYKATKNNQTIVEVKNETTLDGSKRLLTEGFEKVIALNFASAKNPGGGFLEGSGAQEESLARSSALYDWLFSYRLLLYRT